MGYIISDIVILTILLALAVLVLWLVWFGVRWLVYALVLRVLMFLIHQMDPPVRTEKNGMVGQYHKEDDDYLRQPTMEDALPKIEALGFTLQETELGYIVNGSLPDGTPDTWFYRKDEVSTLNYSLDFNLNAREADRRGLPRKCEEYDQLLEDYYQRAYGSPKQKELRKLFGPF